MQCHINTSSYYCILDNLIVFSGSNFTLIIGDELCFEVIILDDDIIEDFLRSEFTVTLQNGLLDPFFTDFTQIIVRDNEG